MPDGKSTLLGALLLLVSATHGLVGEMAHPILVGADDRPARNCFDDTAHSVAGEFIRSRRYVRLQRLCAITHPIRRCNVVFADRMEISPAKKHLPVAWVRLGG